MKLSLAVLALLGTTEAIKVTSKAGIKSKLQAKTQAKAKLNPYNAHSIMEAFDANGNGTITQDEFASMLKDLC